MKTCFERVLIVVIVSLIIGLNDNRMLNASATEKPIYKDSAGDEYEYEGQLKDNLPHGQGIATYSNGDKYVGVYKNGKMHGQGTYTLTNGDKYVGEWKYGMGTGHGTYTYANGDKYIGGWKDEKKHGWGTLISNSTGKIGSATIFVHSFNLPLKRLNSYAKVPLKHSQLSLSSISLMVHFISNLNVSNQP